MAHEYQAFTTRGAEIVAISPDSPEQSRALASRYDLPFPLVEDEELTLSRAYVGVDSDDFPIPGIVVVAPDRTVVLRRTGSTPADRVPIAELLAVVDTTSKAHEVGRSSTVVNLSGGYKTIERRLVRLVSHAGVLSGPGGAGFAIDADLAGLYPLHRNIAVGGLIRTATGRTTRIDFDAALRLRYPILGDAGELYLQLPAGVSTDPTGDGVGSNFGAQLGMQFALFPSLAIVLEAATTYHRLSDEAPDETVTVDELRFTLGLGVGLLF